MKITKKLLKIEYKKNKTAKEIANLFNCSESTIYNALKKYKIQIPRRKGKNHWGWKGNKATRRQKYYCIDCDKEIHRITALYRAGRCHKCANKIITDNQRFPNNKCKVCGKEISYKSKKCKECYCKSLIDKHAYNYKGGRPKCVDCGKLIWYGFERCQSCAQKLLWNNEKHRNKMIKLLRKGLRVKPNKPEKVLKALLNILLPKEYKFVGDGEIILGGFNPDFINCNGQKKIIELYGDYWHNRKDAIKRDKLRLIAYKNYGYKTLIIWEHELKDLEKVNNKVLEFNRR